MEWFAQNTHWVWLIAGILFMALEIFGASGYLLVAGISASILAFASYLFPDMALKWQLLLFGFNLVAFAIALTVWFRTRDKASLGVDVGKPGSDLIGSIHHLQNPLVFGRSKIRLQDANWDVSCPGFDELDVGTAVRIVEVHGRNLIIEKVDS